MKQKAVIIRVSESFARIMKYNLLFAFSMCTWLLTKTVQTTNPVDFLKEINGYKKVCKSLDCTTDNRNVIAFQANLKHNLQNLPINTALKFDNVRLNKGGGYDPNTGIFTAPEDGVYSFAWSFLSNNGN
ncbi:uncharacterized protein LOC111108853 [Crassostrea virginica]